MMIDMMRETLLTGTARKAEIPNWDAAGKTGTTQDYRDAWFVGYTATLVTGVWFGNDDDSPMKKVTGSGLPAEVWNRFMRAALAGSTPVPLPAAHMGTRTGAVRPVAAARSRRPPSAPSYPPAPRRARRQHRPAPLVMNAGAVAGQARAGAAPGWRLAATGFHSECLARTFLDRAQPRPKSFLEAIFGN